MINDILCNSMRVYFGWNIKCASHDVLVYDLKQLIICSNVILIHCCRTIIDSPLTLEISDDYTVSLSECDKIGIISNYIQDQMNEKLDVYIDFKNSDGDGGLKQMSVVYASSQQEHEVEEEGVLRRRLSKKTTFSKTIAHITVEAGIDAELELKFGVSMELFKKGEKCASTRESIVIVTKPIGRAALLLTLGASGFIIDDSVGAFGKGDNKLGATK